MKSTANGHHDVQKQQLKKMDALIEEAKKVAEQAKSDRVEGELDKIAKIKVVRTDDDPPVQRPKSP